MSRTLTILHLVSLRGMGGRAATALRQVRLLAARGHKVLVGCLAGSTAEARSREMGLPVFSEFHFRRGFRPLCFWSDCRRVARICNEHQVDVLHAHLSQESWVACLGARLARRRPALIRSRGVVVPIKPHLFNRLLHNRYTDRVIVPSKVIHDQLVALPGFDAAKIALIRDGVDLARFSPEVGSAAIRREFNIPSEAPLVVMVARLERVKGHEIFFQALSQIVRENKVPNLRAICACDERTAGMFDATVQQARALGLDERTLAFTGLRPAVEQIVAAANVVALPSLGSEGSSRVALEAAACAVPVVASSVGCLPEVIADGVTGRIVPPAQPQALAAALTELLLDPKRAREMGRAARRRAEEHYDERAMVAQLEGAYFAALGQPAPVPQEAAP